jgi:hypothetical protein
LGLVGRIPFDGGRRVWALAVGLEALEFVEGAVEGALDAGFVAAEGGDGFRIPAKDIGELLVVAEIGVILIDVIAVVDEAEVEEAGLDIAAAGEAPLGHDDLGDEGGFEGAGGPELVFKLLKEFVESLLVFAGDDGVFGGEAVCAGVVSNGGLAFGGLWAGAELGVSTVRGDLLFGSHELLGLLGKKNGACW